MDCRLQATKLQAWLFHARVPPSAQNRAYDETAGSHAWKLTLMVRAVPPLQVTQQASSLRRRRTPQFNRQVIERKLFRRERHAALLVVELRGEGDQTEEPQAHAEPLSALALRSQRQCASQRRPKSVEIARRGAPRVSLLCCNTHRRQSRRGVVQNRLRILAAIIPPQLVVLRHLWRALHVSHCQQVAQLLGGAAGVGARGPGRAPPESPARRARPAGRRRRERPQWH